ncbi:hypothetical protein BDN72DRAFT_907555 [Pluteus cervinus]|uniref:Uncharacterized protein n=1 Tax=Pluteus cervinus TaxID=181527 RepID=A0ACD2ZWI5_9AGAR|nr:hypothetical protein BDN72DRAFT_907555 [Pluteus cervinus]
MVNPIYFDPTYYASDYEIDCLIVELQAEIRAVMAVTQALGDSINGLLRLVIRRRAFIRSYPLAPTHRPTPRSIRGASSGRSGAALPLSSNNPNASLARRHASAHGIPIRVLPPSPSAQTRALFSPLDRLAHAASVAPQAAVASSSTNTLDREQLIPRPQGGRRRGPSSDSDEFEREFDIVGYVLDCGSERESFPSV